MSYGQNQPAGLQATRSLGAATWNGQTNPYYIQSGYNNNIFKGDPVMVAGAADGNTLQSGYLISLYDASVIGTGYQKSPMIGIFDGVAFTTTTATNPVNPAASRPFWPAGTLTLNNLPAVAYVVDDPNTVFNIQTALNIVTSGANQTKVGSTLAVNFSLIPTTNTVNGNFQLSTSLVSATDNVTNLRGANSNQNNLLVVGLVPSPPNLPADPTTGAVSAFNNIEVLIMNHAYVTRPNART